MQSTIKGFKCINCDNSKVTHVLIRGDLVEGYTYDPLCSACENVLDQAKPHVWDNNKIVEIVDLIHPDRNFLLDY